MHCFEIELKIGSEIKNEPVRDDIKAAEDHNFGARYSIELWN